MAKKARTNPRKKLALSEMNFWIDLALVYEDALTEHVLRHSHTWVHPSDKWDAAVRQLKSRGRIA